MAGYIDLNKTNWDERADLHASSKEYALRNFTDDPSYISNVVRFDTTLLGDVSGLKGIHLQCHIGTDTVSLARLGAEMTGLDFSAKSISQARLLAERCGLEIKWLESDVYKAEELITAASFDFVYTGIGALCWLPRIDLWAATVSRLLRPGGRLFIREGHPMLWAINEERADDLVVEYPYFELEKPMVCDGDSTYVETDAKIKATTTHQWNHGLGEIISAVLANGMRITGLTEHDSAPWEALPGRMYSSPDGEWRLAKDPWRLPLTYTLQAVKS